MLFHMCIGLIILIANVKRSGQRVDVKLLNSSISTCSTIVPNILTIIHMHLVDPKLNKSDISKFLMWLAYIYVSQGNWSALLKAGMKDGFSIAIIGNLVILPTGYWNEDLFGPKN